MNTPWLYEWTKRLGQQHWSRPGSSETLCGMPMLGNNYSKTLERKDKVPCEQCLAKEQQLRGEAI